MEKKIKEVDTFKYTPIKKKITVYIASNGVEFKTEKQCLQAEKEIMRQEKFDKIKKMEISSEFFPNSWYYANDEEELMMIKDCCGYNVSYDIIKINNLSKKKADLKVRDWIGYEYKDGGDYRGTYCIYTLSYLKDQISDFLNMFMFKK